MRALLVGLVLGSQTGCLEAIKLSEPSGEGLGERAQRLEAERHFGGPGETSEGKAGVVWVRLSGGSFLMGSPEEVGFANEHPQRLVTVRAFELSKTEVTVAQYAACVQAGACSKPTASPSLPYYSGPPLDRLDCHWEKPGREDYPINCLYWYQAKEFAAWVGGRLPTEAEWEYAARSGGRTRAFPWGDEDASCREAVVDVGEAGCGERKAWPVCSKPLGNSAQGVCDLAGNVWEWVEDEPCDYAQAPTDGSAAACTSEDRVARGGSWNYPHPFSRAAYRASRAASHQESSLGFRVAR